MQKLYLLLLLYSIGIASLSAQQDAYKFRLGVYSGMMNYYGDLNQRLISPNNRIIAEPLAALSYGVSLEKSFSQSWSGKLLHTSGKFYANDRAIHWDGSPDTNRSNYARSLNAKTNIKDLSLIFIYSLDNDYLFSRRAFVSPYFTFGLGYTNFEVYGDLYDASGNRYHYWSDNTIRNESEASPAAGNAAIIEQDGRYETNLSRLNTERAYINSAFNIPFGAGIKFRISSRFNLNLDFTARYAFTDYLDDVSGDYRNSYDNEQQEYAANPTNQTAKMRGDSKDNDFYSFTSISLHYNFGKKIEKYIAPKIYPSAYYLEAAPDTQSNTSETNEFELATKVVPSIVTEVESLDYEAFTPIPVTSDIAKVRRMEDDSDRKRSQEIDSTRSPQGRFDYEIINRYTLQNDTIRQLEYEVKKLKLQNELYELKRNSPVPEIRRKFMEDSITLQSLYLIESLSENNFVKIKNDSLDTTSNAVKNSAITDSTGQRVTADSNREIKTAPLSSDSMRMIRMQSQIEELKEALSRKNRSNPGQHERYLIDQLQERIDVLSREIRYHQLGARELRHEDRPPAIAGNRGKDDIINLERKMTDLSVEIGKVIQSKVDQDSINNLVLESVTRSEAELNKKISDLDRDFQQITAREDSIRQAQVEAERDSLKKEVRQLRETLASLRASTPDTVERDVITIPELPKTEVFFKVNSSELSDNDIKRINEVARVITRYPQIMVTIKGFTDQTGSIEYNRILSQKRAHAVERVLLSANILANRITVESNGVDNDLKNKASQYGRRVEILVSSK